VKSTKITPPRASRNSEDKLLKWTTPIVLALLCACASRRPLEEPTIKAVPATLIPDSGASLYLIEAPDDWLDDTAHDIALTIKAPKNTIWIGEQTLKEVLRYALSRKEVSFKAQGDFLITSGCPVEATLTHPESVDAPPPVGFHVKLTASYSKSPGYFDYELAASIVTTNRKGIETADTIAEGGGKAPLRATLLMSRIKAADRGYFLLLRISTLEK
jgi:hypothetical protein